MVIVTGENIIPAATMSYSSTENRQQSSGQYKKTHIYYHLLF
jgi:hypothetical protein